MSLAVLVWGTVIAVALSPVFVLAHELGHAFVALKCTDGDVEVIVGQRGRHWRRRYRRVLFAVSLGPSIAMSGQTRVSGIVSRPWQRKPWVAYLLAGPAAHTSAGAVLAAGGLAFGSGAVALAGGMGMFAGLVNLLPHQTRRHASDGARLATALRRRPERRPASSQASGR